MSNFVPHPLDDCPPPLEEPSHPVHPQDSETNLAIGEMLQFAVNTILVTLYFVITLLFRFATDTVPDPLDDTLPALGEEASYPEHPQDPGEAHLSGVQQIVVTAIRATDLTLGLQRIPAGFHVVVKTHGIEFQTSNKPVHVDQAVVEWNEPILLPCEPSSLVRVSVYASFELGPMLGHGEVLRTFEMSMGELLDRSEKLCPRVFQPKQAELVSPCTSLLVTVERRCSDDNCGVLSPLTTVTSGNRKALILRADTGHHLLARYRRRQNSVDLDQSIKHFERASDLCPVDDPCRPATLFNLAIAKFLSCQVNGTSLDLDIPISLFQEALALRPTGHPDRPTTQLYLAISLLSRFAKRGFQTDADVAGELMSEVLEVCHANSHIYRAALLAIDTFALHRVGGMDGHDIGHMQPAASMLPLSPNHLVDRAERCLQRDDPHDLDEVISLHYDALRYYDSMDDRRAQLLNNLANVLSTRFEHRGNDQDLCDAVMLLRDALALHPVGHPDRSKSLNNLAIVLSTHFEHRGNDQDLDDAVMLHRDALALHPVGHPDRSSSLNNLANVLSTRFEHRGNDQDLCDAVMLLRDALALHPVGHPDRSSLLNNLADGLFTRFKHQGNDQDLDDAIMFHRDALALRPVGHSDRSMSLNNLANVLSTRFKHRGNDQDLDDAVMLHRDALALYPVGHPNRSSSLGNLAIALKTRFEHRRDREDLHESQENLCCALTLLTQHDRRLFIAHGSLANVYMLFHQSGLNGTGEYIDSLAAAMHHLQAAANVVSGGLLSRLRASLRWVNKAHEHSHATELEAYATSMQLLDTYMSATASVSSRHDAMKNFPSMLAVDAASCALRSGNMCRAVELLEQGRTIIWTQMTRLRTPLDGLQDLGDHAVSLMKKFRHLSSLLDAPPANHAEGTPGVNVEAEASRYRRLVEDWNRVVEDIRKIEGFSRFLLPPLFSDLQNAARDGPIIVLVASNSSCNAIIIPHNQPPINIKLCINLEKLQHLVVKLQRASQSQAAPKPTPKATPKPSPKRTQSALMKALMELWDDVVSPVVDNLGGFAPPGSRIWWCPTSFFNFLPFHAAGAYRQGGQLLSNLYISSYTPSLTALIRARRSHDRSLSVPFAAIGQNHPAGHPFILECVEPELELVRNLLPPPPTVSFTKITSAEAIKSRALRALRDNTWLHFSCHGTQNYTEPFKSAFLMRDQPLSLLDISQMDLSRHEFAFLSACETAVGDVNTPDEVIHLAASLQFAGVQSVIGTLWSVNDSTVQRLVEAFYKNLCGDGKMNSKRAARALHRAVQSLAGDEEMPLDQRIVFMHIGI
ncbi:CHAT domain-containing protein [Suillus clintonianus]|uniref:CHAT domain-containing protein n=1 Tax=Suillus clintonianus TaxID=1904413 RepID=UPI001B87A497|nr:CHAT domain-containing protein [Suillus clintonianus]KAG2125692.1 CHAT domain-containing protein [Suillus clintonianus]